MQLLKPLENTNIFLTLLKHFVRRLVNNDFLTYEDQRQEWMVVILVILAIFGGYISHKLLVPYLFPKLTGVTPHSIWIKNTAFLTLTMALTGIFSVFNWGNLFLDNRDYINILPLPVKSYTIYTAKFYSVLIFVGLLSTAFNFFSLFVFTFYIGSFSKLNLIFYGISQFLTNFLGNLFVFLSVACIQSIFTIFFRNKLFKKLANVLQTLLLMGFIGVIVWLPQIIAYLPNAKKNLSTFFYCFPPLWYTGINEKIVGFNPGPFTAHMFTGLIAILIASALYWLSFPLTLRQYLSGNQLTGERKFGVFTQIVSKIKYTFDSFFLRNPIQRGMFYFIIHTLRRSRKHQLQLVMYIAIPTAYIVADLVYYKSQKGWSYFKTPNFFLVGVSFIILTFLATGIRMIVRHPFSIGANWLFRMTEAKEKKHYFIGAKKAFIFQWGIPLFVIIFIFYTICWGIRLALFHSLFSLCLFFLLLELLFYTYNKIPFAGEFEPGKPNIKLYWPLILGGFLECLVQFSHISLKLFKHPLYYILVFLSVIAIYSLLSWSRNHRYKQAGFNLIYSQELPDFELISNFSF